MLGPTLLKGSFSRQCERINRHFDLVRLPRTVRVSTSRIQPLFMQIEPDVSVYAKTNNALQTARALLTKVCTFYFRNRIVLPEWKNGTRAVTIRLVELL